MHVCCWHTWICFNLFFLSKFSHMYATSRIESAVPYKVECFPSLDESSSCHTIAFVNNSQPTFFPLSYSLPISLFTPFLLCQNVYFFVFLFGVKAFLVRSIMNSLGGGWRMSDMTSPILGRAAVRHRIETHVHYSSRRGLRSHGDITQNVSFSSSRMNA